MGIECNRNKSIRMEKQAADDHLHELYRKYPFEMWHTCLNVKRPFSGFRRFGGVSGRRGLSGPISEPLDSESCILSTL